MAPNGLTLFQKESWVGSKFNSSDLRGAHPNLLGPGSHCDVITLQASQIPARLKHAQPSHATIFIRMRIFIDTVSLNVQWTVF